MRVVHRQKFGLFWNLRDFTAFESELEELSQLAKETDCSYLVFMLGWEDVKDAMAGGLDLEEIFNALLRRLMHIVSMTSKPIVFGGLLKKGGKQLEDMIEKIHQELYRHSKELRSYWIFHFDVSSPSPRAHLVDVYNWDGDFSKRFKAVALFSLSRVVSLFIHNMWTPTPTYAISPAGINFLLFAARKRGGDREEHPPYLL